ncbi:Concanavalin A-like lectin/glucanases superfamily protein [Friedmanniella luteola]|uniref:Concanavalin A-like lectin/glucanases superfamily protein n=1 Tax=Friedmanniella luteola TaxID=546871 RepID=A0A1H1RHL6_9ACTN|nr:LamG domain-containing protein [Friedmanniella luteola]SDS35143.1 Concanavalin A-like lectin/glucanases superfamily protein [Friedmanniella luteola]
MTRRPAVARRWQHLVRGPLRHLLMVTLVVVLVLSAAAALVPGSRAAITAQVTNGTNGTKAADYFTCAAAYTANTPGIYYKLDDTGTTAADSGASARTGTYQGAVTKGVAGACTRDTGTAITLDGTTGYVNYATALTTNTSYTSEAWIRTTTARGGLITGFGAAATGASSTTDRVLYLTNTGRVAFGVNNAAKATLTTPNPYNDGAWHHIMATAGPTGLTLYVDGTAVTTSATVIAASYSGNFRVGYDNLTGWTNAPTSSFLAASVDDVAVYGRTLTATDALNHYTSGRRPT